MSIPARFLDELRSRLTLSEVAGKRLRLERAGREFRACCPFHNEKTASFYINDDKQFYHCFGCGAHGDVIGFMMQHDNLSFIEAVESLAALAGMQVPKASSEDREKSDREKSLYALMDETARFMQRCLHEPAGREALRYIRDRGVSVETIAAFRVGYAPEDGRSLRSFLLAKGFTDNQMIEAGVFRPSKHGGEPFFFFRERIIFPVPDRRGRIVAFGGRVLPEHLRPPASSGFKPPKYINSSDTPLFDKGSMLYGEPHARQAAADGQKVIVVEGYLDVISCFQAGFRGALAPMGTALTEEQITVLWKIIPAEEKSPVLCFDGDDAGRRAAARACTKIIPLLKPGHTALFAFLPQGEDPDSLIRSSGGRALQKVIDSALPLVDYLWTFHASGRALGTPEGQAGLSKALEEEVSKIADRSVQTFYRQAFRQRISEAFFSRPQVKTGKARKEESAVAIHLSRPARKISELHRTILAATAINHPEILGNVEEELMALDLSGFRIKDLLQEVINIWQENEGIDAGELKKLLNDRGYQEILDKLLSSSIYIHAGFARPESSPERALQGWREIMDRMNMKELLQEHREACAALASDITDENVDRMLALYNLTKAGDV